MKLLAKVHNADAAKSGRWGLGRKVAGNAAEAVGNAAKAAGNAAKAARQCWGDPKMNGESSKINGESSLGSKISNLSPSCRSATMFLVFYSVWTMRLLNDLVSAGFLR